MILNNAPEELSWIFEHSHFTVGYVDCCIVHARQDGWLIFIIYIIYLFVNCTVNR